MVGLLVSVAVNCFIGIGSILYGQKPPLKSLNTDLCYQNITNNANFTDTLTTLSPTTLLNSTIFKADVYVNTGFNRIFDISYYWYSLIAVCIVFVLGTIISLMTKRHNKEDLDDNLFFHMVSRIKNKRVNIIFILKNIIRENKFLLKIS